MKKAISLLLLLALLTGLLCACSSSDADTAAGPTGSLEEILAGIYELTKPEFDVMNIPVELSDPDSVKYYTGLDSADGITEILVSESALGAHAYSLVLLRLADPADASQVAQQMFDNIDTRKWICVEAEDLRVAAAGDVVLLIMRSSRDAQLVTAEGVVDAFEAQCSGPLTTELS